MAPEATYIRTSSRLITNVGFWETVPAIRMAGMGRVADRQFQTSLLPFAM